MSIKVGVVGATGVVGETFLSLIEKRNFPVEELRLFASSASAGKLRRVKNQVCEVQVLQEGCFDGLDLVFFSSGDEISRQWGPLAVAAGAFAIDNSAAFRMSDSHKLVVPEVNGDILPKPGSPELIANPNCSTIQLVLALAPLDKQFGLTDVRVATYQAVSGAGKEGIEELKMQNRDENYREPKVFPHSIAHNCLPHIGSFNDDGFCSEEVKIMTETRKILRQPKLRVSAFTVRVPVENVHAEAVWVTFTKEATKDEVIKALKSMPGIDFVPHDSPNNYPHQRGVSGQDNVAVGRLHQDMYDPKTWIFWVVGDNLLKGAALNGLQIAERIYS